MSPCSNPVSPPGFLQLLPMSTVVLGGVLVGLSSCSPDRQGSWARTPSGALTCSLPESSSHSVNLFERAEPLCPHSLLGTIPGVTLPVPCSAPGSSSLPLSPRVPGPGLCVFVQCQLRGSAGHQCTRAPAFHQDYPPPLLLAVYTLCVVLPCPSQYPTARAPRDPRPWARVSHVLPEAQLLLLPPQPH